MIGHSDGGAGDSGINGLTASALLFGQTTGSGPCPIGGEVVVATMPATTHATGKDSVVPGSFEHPPYVR